MKTAVVRLLLKISGSILRSQCSPKGKAFFWERICVPYLSWRDVEIVSSTSCGKFFTIPNDFVENRICFFGVWEPIVTRLFGLIAHPGDVVVDVGANIGYYSVLASKLVGHKGKVFAIEPSESIRSRLERNFALNSLTNGLTGISVLPYGAWHQSDEAKLNFVEGNTGGSSLSTTSPNAKSESIALRTLDSLIPSDLHSRVRLMKIDVEGAEEFALLGAESILRSATNLTLVCEIDPDRMAKINGSAQRLIDFMRKLEFCPYRIDNDYSVEAYMRPPGQIRLSQVTTCPTEPCDLVFFSSASKLAFAKNGLIELA